MDAKRIITVVLLVFVVVSVAAMVFRELRPGPQPPEARPAASTPKSEEPASATTDKIIAYYFHGNVRCSTCNTIEAYTHEAIRSGFADLIEQGRIEWRVLNYQKPDNKHFQKDFNLVAPMVVLATMHDGAPAKHKVLEQVWMLVDDKKAFLDYVQDETRAYLGGR